MERKTAEQFLEETGFAYTVLSSAGKDEINAVISAMEAYAKQEIEELQILAHEGLPNECVRGWDEVKFCDVRQGDGNQCKQCSNYR